MNHYLLVSVGEAQLPRRRKYISSDLKQRYLQLVNVFLNREKKKISAFEKLHLLVAILRMTIRALTHSSSIFAV